MNNKIFIDKFGETPVRFVFIKESNAVFVSKEDIKKTIYACMTEKMRLMPDNFFNESFDFFTHKSEKSRAVIEVDRIGPVVNIFSAGNLMHNFSELHDAKYEDLRESAFRINSLSIWYVGAMSNATEYFGLTIMDTLNIAKEHLDKHIQPFNIRVDRDTESGYWFAECDEIGLVTEGRTVDELTERVWEIAPDLVKENNLDIHPESIRLSFDIPDVTEKRQML